MILPHIIPDYWKGLWPITYYLLGAFLASSNKKLSFKELVIVIFILDILSIFGLAAISETSFGIEYRILPVFLLSSLIFYSVIHLKVSLKNEWLKRVILFISKNTLPIYLLSVIGDLYWYPKIIAKWGGFCEYFTEISFDCFLFVMPIYINNVFIIKCFKIYTNYI